MTLKILVTGSDGRFAKILKKKNKKLVLVFKTKKELEFILQIEPENREAKKKMEGFSR